MLLNQHLLYRQRDLFLSTGHGLVDIEPYWHGALGIVLMATLTLAVHWQDMPEAALVVNTLRTIETKVTRWLYYLLCMEDEATDDSAIGSIQSEAG